MRVFWMGLLVSLALTVPSALPARSKNDVGATTVDSGTFSILVGGRKIGTETFTIKQMPDVNIASSEIKIEDGQTKARQTSEFRLSPSGELQRYEWREIAPGKAEVIVEPQEQFLVEHILPGEKGKKIDQPFLMPASTLVLDDFFFSQREILVWRYLASVCKTVNGQMQCISQKSKFGIIIPRQHSSGVVSVEYVGHDKIAIHGSEIELTHFRLTSDDSADWDLWIDSHQKLVRILISTMNTEVVRD